LAAWVVVQVPSVAAACSVCTAGRDDENAAAFLISTIFMSLTPLIVIGGIIYLLVHRVRKFEAERQARRDAASTPGSPSTT
jgi:heme/copper-type cytochrome/quinol oxidase subunit 2